MSTAFFGQPIVAKLTLARNQGPTKSAALRLHRDLAACGEQQRRLAEIDVIDEQSCLAIGLMTLHRAIRTLSAALAADARGSIHAEGRST